MKTFEEAVSSMARINITVGELSSGNTSEDNYDLTEKLYAPYAGIAEEARNNEEIGGMILAWACLNDRPSALFSAFMSGLIIGMEMEKAE